MRLERHPSPHPQRASSDPNVSLIKRPEWHPDYEDANKSENRHALTEGLPHQFSSQGSSETTDTYEKQDTQKSQKTVPHDSRSAPTINITPCSPRQNQATKAAERERALPHVSNLHFQFPPSMQKSRLRVPNPCERGRCGEGAQRLSLDALNQPPCFFKIWG